MISSNLKRCLQDLENRIDPDEEMRLRKSWIDFSNGNHQADIFSPLRYLKRASTISWQPVTINAALEDFEAMALQQYGLCSTILANASGEILNVRCNYGTAIMPSLFGLELFIMDEELKTLPTSRPVKDFDEIERLLDLGIPDLGNGFGARVFQMGEFFAELAHSFPRIKEFVSVYHPDLQGPLDICELILGSKLFYALYDQPDLVKALLRLTCDTYTLFLNTWNQIHPFHPEGSVHWGMFHHGNIMLRDDSAMNLSPEMVREFVLPYDQQLLSTFHGGAIHFCGKGDHFIQDISKMTGVYAINLSQPEYNDMEKIYQNTIDKGIALLGLKQEAARAALSRGRELHHRVHIIY